MGIDPINIKPQSIQTPAADNSSKSPNLKQEIANIKARRPDVEIVDDKTGDLISKPSNGQPPVAKWGVDDSSSSTAAPTSSSAPPSKPAHKSSPKPAPKPPVKKGNWFDKNIVGPIKKTVSKVTSWFKKVF